MDMATLQWRDVPDFTFAKCHGTHFPQEPMRKGPRNVVELKMIKKINTYLFNLAAPLINFHTDQMIFINPFDGLQWAAVGWCSTSSENGHESGTIYHRSSSCGKSN